MKEILQFTGNNYFCSSSVRPKNCIKAKSKEGYNGCCLFCTMIGQCKLENKTGTQPCTLNVVSADEYCPYSI